MTGFSWENRRIPPYLRSYICTVGKEGRAMRKLLSGILMLSAGGGPAGGTDKRVEKI